MPTLGENAMAEKGKTADKEKPDEREVPHESLTNKANQDHQRANPDKDKAMLEKGQPSRR